MFPMMIKKFKRNTIFRGGLVIFHSVLKHCSVSATAEILSYEIIKIFICV